MVSKPKGSQVQVLGYYSPDAAQRLRELSEATRVPQSAYLREALDDLLKKRIAGAKRPRAIGGKSGEYLGSAFSQSELMAAAEVIKGALSDGRSLLDPEALKRVLAKLTMAYKWKLSAGANPAE